MRRLALSLLAALSVLAVAPEKNAQAQEILLTGPLAGATPVKRLRLYREGRFEIAPSVAFTMLDEYNHTLFTGAKATYYVTDWLGFGVWGAYGLAQTSSDLTDQVDAQAPRNQFTAINVNPYKSGQTNPKTGGTSGFYDQVGKISWIVSPQATAVPFRGKLALFQKVFVDSEAYFFLGLGIVGVQERPDCSATRTSSGQKACNLPETFTTAMRVAVAPTFGLGLTFFAADFLNFSLEYRALPFSWNQGGYDSKGGQPDGNFPDNQIDSNDWNFKFNSIVAINVGFMIGERKLSK